MLIEKAHIHMSLEQVTMRAGRKVLMYVDNNILLIVGDPQGILNQKLRPRPIHLLNIKKLFHLIYHKITKLL